MYDFITFVQYVLKQVILPCLTEIINTSLFRICCSNHCLLNCLVVAAKPLEWTEGRWRPSDLLPSQSRDGRSASPRPSDPLLWGRGDKGPLPPSVPQERRRGHLLLPPERGRAPYRQPVVIQTGSTPGSSASTQGGPVDYWKPRPRVKDSDVIYSRYAMVFTAVYSIYRTLL